MTALLITLTAITVLTSAAFINFSEESDRESEAIAMMSKYD